MEALLPIAERLAQQEPLNERALRTLMRAYQVVGRRGEALAAYERCVTLLHNEIGVEPEPSTRALAQAIRVATPHVLRDPRVLETTMDSKGASGPAKDVQMLVHRDCPGTDTTGSASHLPRALCGG